ncbi:hypothetical protein BJ964_009322 [Actinoplanes lobatus]|uniref:Uncharacterized protein n=1 Tax=Actinoplanes lobatus TaxID=113568 RepID=A0A7W7MMA4_9ACTN|nr:hypothetical protein [Actinoplanes lobatus]
MYRNANWILRSGCRRTGRHAGEPRHTPSRIHAGRHGRHPTVVIVGGRRVEPRRRNSGHFKRGNRWCDAARRPTK